MTKNHLTKKCQSGQALPLGVALILFGVLFALVMFNSSQVITEKSRLTNAADAAAYSGLVWQARALNFSAYTNRAMVANQVSIAQFVSLNSWSRYAKDLAEQADNSLGKIPFIAPYTKTISTYADLANKIVGQIADAAVPVISQLNEVLSQSQEAMYYASFVATPQIVKDVAKANHPEYQADSDYALVSLATNLYQWKNFTQRYGDNNSNAGIPRKVKVIENSLDDFSAHRNWDIGTVWLGVRKRADIEKEGTSHLWENDGEYEWIAKDGLSIHWEHYRCSWRSGCKWRNSEMAVAGGGAYGSENICPDHWVAYREAAELAGYPGLSDEDIEAKVNSGEIDVKEDDDNCRLLDSNKRSESRADNHMEEVDGYEGVKSYRDIKALTETQKDPRITLRVKLHLRPRHVRTSESVDGLGSATQPGQTTLKRGPGSGVFRTGDGSAGSELASVSSAELYFKRPDDKQRYDLGKQRELGNLFNPYWQVRLVATPMEQQLVAWATQDKDILTAGDGLSTALSRYSQRQQEELEYLAARRGVDMSTLNATQQMVGSEALDSYSQGLNSAVGIYQQLDGQDAEAVIAQLSAQGQSKLNSDMSSLTNGQLKDSLNLAGSTIGDQQFDIGGIDFEDFELKPSYEIVEREYESSKEAISEAQKIALDFLEGAGDYLDNQESDGTTSDENVDSEVALSMQDAIDEADALIANLETARIEEINTRTESLNQLIAKYQTRIANYDPDVHDRADIASWERKLRGHQSALVSAPAQIRSEYNGKIARIQRELQAFRNSHNSLSAELSSELQADIAALRANVQALLNE